jgi:hypothetical protein
VHIERGGAPPGFDLGRRMSRCPGKQNKWHPRPTKSLQRRSNFWSSKSIPMCVSSATQGCVQHATYTNTRKKLCLGLLTLLHILARLDLSLLLESKGTYFALGPIAWAGENKNCVFLNSAIWGRLLHLPEPFYATAHTRGIFRSAREPSNIVSWELARVQKVEGLCIAFLRDIRRRYDIADNPTGARTKLNQTAVLSRLALKAACSRFYVEPSIINKYSHQRTFQRHCPPTNISIIAAGEYSRWNIPRGIPGEFPGIFQAEINSSGIRPLTSKNSSQGTWWAYGTLSSDAVNRKIIWWFVHWFIDPHLMNLLRKLDHGEVILMMHNWWTRWCYLDDDNWWSWCIILMMNSRSLKRLICWCTLDESWQNLVSDALILLVPS